MQLIRLGYLVCAIYGLGGCFMFKGRQRIACVVFAMIMMLIFYWIGISLFELENRLDHSGLDL